MSDTDQTPGTSQTRHTTVTPAHLQFFDFLSPEDHQALVDHVAEHLDSMNPSSVTSGALATSTYDTTQRRSLVDGNVEKVWPLVEGTIVALFPHLRRELGTGHFALGSIERQLTVHKDGDFFALHLDDNQPMTDGCRMITFVYYFNAAPKQFQGGELRLYDTAIDPDGTRHAADSYRDIEPIDNSIVFFAADSYHEVLPVRQTGDGSGAMRCTVNGWFHAGDLGRPRRTFITHDLLAAIAPRILPNLSGSGFSLRPTPESVQARLLEFWNAERDNAVSESAPVGLFPDGSPELVPIGELGREILEELLPLHTQWAGTELRPVAAYGLRVYGTGQTEALHTERPETHVVSSVLVVDQDLDSPWPITIDVQGRRHVLRPEIGQMLLYEGASTPQSHPVPLDGRSQVVLLLHYSPTQWSHSADSIVRAAVHTGLIDNNGRLLPSVATTH